VAVAAVSQLQFFPCGERGDKRYELIHPESRLGSQLMEKVEHINQALVGFELRTVAARVPLITSRNCTQCTGKTPDRGGFGPERG
jgi:hypothetical protein